MASSRQIRLLAGAAALLTVATSCTESLESSAGCPELCPAGSLELREVVLDAIEFDATIGGFPTLGNAAFFALAVSGDTLDSRMVVRFDSLADRYTFGGVEQIVTAVDSAHIRLFIDSAETRAKSNLTIEVYDVDTTAADANNAAVLAQFKPSKLIGTATFAPAALLDVIDIPVSNAVLFSKIAGNRRLRVGIRLRSDSSAMLLVNTANQELFPRLRYDAAPQNSILNVFDRVPRSWTPIEDTRLAVDYTDYTLVTSGPFPLRKNTTGLDTAGVFRDSVLAVGGVGGRRIYFRFNVPDSVLSASIIRATLILNKKPSSDFGFVNDTLAIVAQAVFAGTGVPVAKAIAFIDSARVFPITSARLVPRNSGEVRYDIVSYARTWTIDTVARIPFAISLRTGLEGRTLQEILFYSTSGPQALRPRLRITYVPREGNGS